MSDTRRVAVVTGGAHGLGRALGGELARSGLDVVIADRDGDAAQEAAAALAHEHAARVLPVQTDVTSSESVDALAAATMAEFGGVDVLVNNAGIWGMGTSWETPLADWHRMMEVNLFGVVHGIRSFVPHLLENPTGGHVVNVASTAGVTGGAYRSAYTASKHAVVGLSKSLRAEFAARGASLKVSVVCPGKVATGIFDSTERKVEEGAAELPEDVRASFTQIRQAGAITADEAARYVVERMAAEEFWIFPGPPETGRSIEKEGARLVDAVRRA